MLQTRKTNFKLLSIIIPTYNQEKTIFKDLKNINDALSDLEYQYEIVVVNDGSTDKTEQKIQKFNSQLSKKQLSINKNIKIKKLKIISYSKNQGKGHAVRVGMLAGRGDIIGFIDAGMDIHTAGFRMLLNHMDWYAADIIVGSKLHPVSKVHYPLYRKILSKGYRAITQILFGFKVKDTQVGLKLFNKKVVRDVFPRLLVKKYAFDIEILAVAYQLGYKRIYEAPVKIDFKENNINKKNLFKIIHLMLQDTAAVFYRIKILDYYRKNK